MCFTPLASIITAIFELGVASYLFYRIRDKKLYPLAVFVLLLGVYQFTEFMLCKSMNTFIWARIGFVSYSFMPILSYHFFINASGNRIKKYAYAIPILFSLVALLHPNFITYTSCNTLHVTVEGLMTNQNLYLMFVYLLYYTWFPVYGVYIFSKKIEYAALNLGSRAAMASVPLAMLLALLYYVWSSIIENDQNLTWLFISMIIIAGILMLVVLSTFIFKRSKKLFYQTNSLVLATSCAAIIVLYYFLPNISYNFPSIFCQFAVLYSISSVFLIDSLEGKIPDS